MTTSAEELFDLFVAHGTSVQEIAQCDAGMLTRQIAEMRKTEPDKIPLVNWQISDMIVKYAKDKTP